MSNTKIYDSIFDVIREFDPESPYIQARDYYKKNGCYINLHPQEVFYSVGLSEKLTMALPVRNIQYAYYRGENNKYSICFSSCCRNNKSKDEKELADLKIVEFELALKQFPQICLAEKDGLYINYIAMAQHYGLDTNYLDLTGDIGVAAFFACTEFDENNNIYPTKNEYAQIRAKPMILPDNPLDPNIRLQIIGLQPFLRPSRQIASCLKLKDGEDFAKESTAYVFKTNPEDSRIIMNCFMLPDKTEISNNYWLFPSEDIINVAKDIKSRKSISNEAIELYCDRYQKDKLTIIKMLESKFYTIINEPIKWISDEYRNKKEKELDEYPYGNNKILARLCYRPVGLKDN